MKSIDIDIDITSLRMAVLPSQGQLGLAVACNAC